MSKAKQEARLRQLADLRQKLLAGAASPPGPEADAKYFDALRRRANAVG